MKEEPLARRKRDAKKEEYAPEPFVARINQLMKEKNISMRYTGIESGLDHQAIRRIKAGRRPDMMYCILLANFFDINPNELLQLAKWPTLKIFDIERASAENLPPEAVDVALDIARIPDPRTRKKVADAVRVLLMEYFS